MYISTFPGCGNYYNKCVVLLNLKWHNDCSINLFGETKMQNYLEDYESINDTLFKAMQESFTADELIKHLMTFDQRFIHGIARMKTITPSLLGYFKKFADVNLKEYVSYDHVIKRLMDSEETHPDILHIIAHSKSVLNAGSLIKNKNIRMDTCDHLAKVFLESESFERLNVAKHISVHPNASDWALRKAIAASDSMEDVYLNAAKNSNASPELLNELSLIENGALKRVNNYRSGGRYGYSSPSEINVDNETLREAIALNPNTPKASLKTMFEQGSVRDLILIHPSLSIEEAFDWLQDPELTIDENGSIIGEGVAISPGDVSTCLDSILKKHADQGILPVLMESKHALDTLFSMGYNLKELVNCKKTKAFTQTCINSAHKEEVAFLLRGMTCSEDENQEKRLNNRHLGLSALSAIQGLFTKTRKLDRHNYLIFLKWLNEEYIFPSAFECTANTLMDAEKTIGLDGIKWVLLEQNAKHAKKASGARDTFLFISELITHENQEATDKQIKLINRWLDKESNSYDELFHDYLMNKCKRDFGREIVPANFYQMFFVTKAEEINEELKKSGKNIRLYLPENTAQLATIGNVQRHCVGSSFYADKCVNGHNIIFAMKMDGALKHGFTFQFDTNTSALLQAEGFCRADVPDEYVAIAKKWITRLLGEK
jgi:hypothetical protein